MNPTKLLLIDDDPIIRAIYRDHFKAAGFDIVEAEDGEEGLKKFDEAKPDVVLLDLKMPKIGGWDWLKLVRQGGRRQVPVVVLTSATAEGRARAADQPAAVFVMRKDIAQPRLVVEAVKTAVDTEVKAAANAAVPSP